MSRLNRTLTMKFNVTASVGAFIIGTGLAWTSPTLSLLRDINSTAQLHLDQIKVNQQSQESWISAWTPIGAIIGALPAGFLADLLGRKKTMIVFTVPWIATWAMLIFGTSINMIYASRFISGIIIGLFCAVLPLYVNEISEDSVRGTIQLNIRIFVFGLSK